jgi:hypothetical protein
LSVAAGVALVAGMMAAFAPRAEAVSATGGTVMTAGGYTYHVFTNSGTFTNNSLTSVDVFLVAGGGGGGGGAYYGPGGGGAGGVVLSNAYPVTPGNNYTITVGGGGTGGTGTYNTTTSTRGGNGTNSAFGTVLTNAVGGGGGGKAAGEPGWGGGCGGGGSSANNGGTGSQGKNGGRGLGDGGANGPSYGGGGGGGCTVTGSTGKATSGGDGGAGTNMTAWLNSLSLGDSGWFSGGGVGGAYDDGKNATKPNGGGGYGGSSTKNGVTNTGGGGAGGRSGDTTGGNGGSGIVVVRYLMSSDSPTMQNLPATNVTTTSAWLNGTLTSTGLSACAVCVLWGETSGGETWNWANTNWLTTPGGGWTNNSPLSINITSADGLQSEKVYYYTFAATNQTTNAVAASPQNFITGELTVTARVAQAWESVGGVAVPGTVTVSRATSCTNVPITVAYSVSGTASNGADYTLLTGTVPMPAGATNADIVIAPWNDLLTEGDETVTITLSPGPYPIAAPGSATVTIVDTSLANSYVSTNGSQTAPYDTWDKAFTNLQAALDYAGAKISAKIYLAGNQTFSTPTNGADATSLYVWQNATNVTLTGGWDTNAAPPVTWIGGTELKRLAASGNRRVLKMSSLANCLMEQVTIRDGANGDNGGPGGGVYFTNCLDVTLSGCVISNNVLSGRSDPWAIRGTGLCADDRCRLVLTNSTVVGNTMTAPGYGGYGGGIVVLNGARMTVVRSQIAKNYASNAGQVTATSGGGGGFTVASGGVLELYETVLNANTNFNAGAGGAGYNAGTLLMRNCLVSDNYDASSAIGGLQLNGGTATVVNCTFANNGTNGVKYLAGVVGVTNCIFSGHVNDFSNFGKNGELQMTNVFYTLSADPKQGGFQGCISNSNPAFIDTVYYHEQSTTNCYTGGYFSGGYWTNSASFVKSMAIDAGDATPPTREPQPNGGKINLGAYGNTEVAACKPSLTLYVAGITNTGALYWGHRSAQLNGSVITDGNEAPVCTFLYWDTSVNSTNAIPVGAKPVGSFIYTLTGLNPGASYAYYITASNTAGVATSLVANFSMHPSPSFLYAATNGNDTAGTNWATAYSTVQKALNLAETNDTIYLAGHTFGGGNENPPPQPNNAVLIWQNATNVTVKGGYDAQAGKGGSDPGMRNAVTELKRTVGNVRVLSMVGLTNCLMEQVTIRDGINTDTGTGYGPGGGGVYFTNCLDVTLSGCVISNNVNTAAQIRGSGLCADDRCRLVLTNSTVVGNTMTTPGYQSQGGGIVVLNGARMTVVRSQIAKNYASNDGRVGDGGGGGGFTVASGGVLELYETVLNANTNSTAGAGGAGCNSGTLLLRNCLVSGNYDAANAIGGLNLIAGTATVVNCTFANNGTNGVRWVAGVASITNSIIWGHTLADLTNFPASTGGVLSNVGYSCFGKVYGKGYGDSTAVMANDNPNSHCITNAPIFVNAAAGNYRLLTKPVLSPGIDAGLFYGLSGWMLGDTDLDGARRKQGPNIDMGAYETVPPKGTVILLR